MIATSAVSDNPNMRPSLPKEQPLRVAYVMQNAGNDLSEDVGQAILIKHKIRGLQQAGHDVSIFRLRGRSVVKIDDLNDMAHVSTIPLGFSNSGLFKFAESGVRRLQRELKLPYFAFIDSFRFYEACSRFLADYDLCHEYGGLFSLGAALACRRLRIPYVLTAEADALLENAVRGTPLRGIHAAVAKREARVTYRLANKIVTVSEPARQHLIKHWQVDADKIVVMPNGVDTELFHPHYDPNPVRAELGLGNAPVVGFVGGFQAWHGLDRLISSFSHILREVPDARLLLVGDGPIRSQIERQAAALGIQTAVTITGFIPQARVPQMLAAIDVAVLPYPRLPQELWFSPLKLYEYMAAGKAIVASGTGQLAQVIRSGHNGLLVGSDDNAAFTRSLVALLQAPQERQRLGDNARQQVLEQHSWKQYIDSLEAVYHAVLSK
ncbi:MAG: glycosyltransferase family 4 protein [Anaerolineaceae bacterium]|nr:glycosyltransferase family 4 protein [Anaerolineaceae bacterium]